MPFRTLLTRCSRRQSYPLLRFYPASPSPHSIYRTPSSGFASHSQLTDLEFFTLFRANAGSFRQLRASSSSCYHSPFLGGIGLGAREYMRSMGFAHRRPPIFSRMQLQKPMLAGYRQYGGHSGLSSPDIVLWSLIGANAFVFFLWQIADPKFMSKHFTISVHSILNGRLHTLLTSAFSQRDPSHLFSNMIGLYFFGSTIGSIFGAKYLLMLYLAGGVAGSLGHALYYAYIFPRLQKIPREYYDPRFSPGALGASGAVTAITLLDIFLFPKRIIYLNLIPLPAALVGAILVGKDLWLARGGDSEISGSAHLAGALVALSAWVAMRWRWF